MSIRTLAARGLSFAHLAGLTSRAARAENEDDERKQREGESDDDYAKRMEELDEEEEKARKAEKERKEEEARKAEEEKKEEEARAKGEEDDDSDPDAEDDDDEMRGSSQAARARRREQARCAAIFASKGAARNPVLAANLAFKTRMTRAEAIATLEGTPAPAGHSGPRCSQSQHRHHCREAVASTGPCCALGQEPPGREPRWPPLTASALKDQNHGQSHLYAVQETFHNGGFIVSWPTAINPSTKAR